MCVCDRIFMVFALMCSGCWSWLISDIEFLYNVYSVYVVCVFYRRNIAISLTGTMISLGKGNSR